MAPSAVTLRRSSSSNASSRWRRGGSTTESTRFAAATPTGSRVHSRIRALPPAVLALVFALPPGAIDSARTATLDVSVRDPGARAIADAVIVAVPVQGVPRAKGERPKEVIDQIDKEFVPGVKVIQVGTAISFPNKDNIRHHVYSFSPAKKFELPLYKGVPAAPIVFDKPGVVVLGCNIHDWMIAYVYVVESPWFGKTE